MGSSLSSSCLCQVDSTKRSEIVVMKEDGEVIRYLEGTRVEDILSGHPHHKIIKCCTERSVLQNSYQLNCNRLYFLLPQGLDVCDAIYDGLIRAAMLKKLISSNMVSEAKNQKMTVEEVKSGGEDSMPEDNEFKSTWGWKPALKTIPEGVSPPPIPNVFLNGRSRSSRF